MGLTLPIIGATGLASEQYRDLAGAENVEGVYVVVAFATVIRILWLSSSSGL